MKKLLLLLLLVAGCGYAASDVADFDVICSSCSSNWDHKITTIHCRADSVLSTACRTPCRHCGQMLAEPGDDVSMTALSGGVHVIKRGHSQ